MAEPTPSFRDAVKVWGRIGISNFGGPAGQIAMMHRVLVEERGWLDEDEFLRALNVCMLLPGPEAQQLATYAGWRLHGVKGGVMAGGLFVLPGALLMLGLSIVAAGFGDLGWVRGLFGGISAVVLAIVIEALQRIAKRALKSRLSWGIAAAAFVALFFFNVPFPLVICGAAITGGLFLRPGPAPEFTATPSRSVLKGFATLFTGLALWAAPLGLIRLTLGPSHVLWQVGAFFSRTAVMTFGGAYAVLAYASQQAVQHYNWLTTPEMVRGLGLAETTPGPLILTLQYIGFLAGWRNPAPFGPLLGGTLAAALTTWVTFVPSFLWILLLAPHLEAVQRWSRLSAALSGVTAAVAGVILSLSLWFAVHVLFGTVDEAYFGPVRLLMPEWRTVNIETLVLAITAGIALLRFHVGLLKVLAAGAVTGLILAIAIP